MDPAARLADYLAGQLDPDEHAALEAELARDPALRADLDAMRAADDHLALIPPATPPPGFEKRLDAAVRSELAAVFDDAGGTAEPAAEAVTETATDELATRRARTTTGPGLPRWLTAVSGAAAAIAVLAGAGIVFSNILGSTNGGDDAVFETQSLDAMDERAFDESAEMAEATDGPLLLGGDRSIDDQDIQSLLEDPEAFEIATRDLDDAAAREIAAPFAQALGAGSPGAAAESPGAEDDDASIAQDAPDEPDGDGPDVQEDAPSTRDGAAELRIDPDVSAAQRAQVGSCLELLLSDTPDVIPGYAELVVYEGEDSIVFGLITEDPATGLFTRREAWIVDRDSCEVRLFAQQ